MAAPPHPERVNIIMDLLKGLKPKEISFRRNVALSTIFHIKSTFIQMVPTLRRDLPDDDQLDLL